MQNIHNYVLQNNPRTQLDSTLDREQTNIYFLRPKVTEDIV